MPLIERSTVLTDYMSKNNQKFKRYVNITCEEFRKHIEDNVSKNKYSRPMMQFNAEFNAHLTTEVRQDVFDKNCEGLRIFIKDKVQIENAKLNKVLEAFSKVKDRKKQKEAKGTQDQFKKQIQSRVRDSLMREKSQERR